MRKLFLFLAIFFMFYKVQISANMNYSIKSFLSSTNILLMINPSTGEIVNASLGAKEFYGYTGLIGMSIYSINLLSSENIKNEMAKAKEENRNHFNFKHLLNNGKIKEVYVISYPMEYEGQNILFSTIIDVTEEKRIANLYRIFKNTAIISLSFAVIITLYFFLKVKNNKKRFEELFENMTEAFAVHEMIYDSQGNPIDYKFIDINPAFEKLTGLKKEISIGKTVKELLPSTEQYWINDYAHVATTGKPLYFKRYSTELNKYFQCYAFSPRKNRFAVAFSDVTEQEITLNKLKEYQHKQLNLTNHIIISLTKLLELHDPYTKQHSENVAILSKKLAEKLNLSKESISKVYYAALLHDIGKTILPKNILSKKERLTEEEFNHIKDHPIIGYKSLNNSPELHDISKIILHHHERCDGRGYPHQLLQNEIPIESRILSVVDAYDAMINDRPYRKAQSKEYAIRELKNNAGTQFDIQVVKIFLKMLK